MSDTPFYYEHGYLLYHRSFPWQVDLYGFHPDGRGDVLFDSAIYAIARNKFHVLTRVATLLGRRKRWPVDLPNERVAHNQIEDWFYGLLYKLKIVKHRKYRSINGMTRDPFIMCYCAAWLMDKKQFIDILSVPWYIDRPDFWAWRKYLRTGEEKYKRMYERYQLWTLRFKQPMYSYHLAAWKAYVAGSDVVKERLGQIFYWGNHAPWNLLIRELIGVHPLEEYVGREGYKWTWDGDGVWDRKLIPDADIALDEEILNWLVLHNKMNAL